MDKSDHKSQNVIEMSDHHPESGYAAIAQVEAYWEALRGTRIVPKRSEIDPRGIEGALENAFIVERVAPGIARLRIAGSHLNDLMGMEVRGMPLTALFNPGASTCWTGNSPCCCPVQTPGPRLSRIGVPGFAAPVATYEAPSAAQVRPTDRRPPYLRLVKSED